MNWSSSYQRDWEIQPRLFGVMEVEGALMLLGADINGVFGPANGGRTLPQGSPASWRSWRAPAWIACRCSFMNCSVIGSSGCR
jgi:hypothetical protein